MDYAKWVKDILEFHSQLGRQPGEWELETGSLPPIDSTAIEAINEKLRHKIPNPVRKFLLTASSGVSCRYFWAPEVDSNKNELKAIFSFQKYMYGGGPFCIAADFENHQAECVESATETWIADYPEEQEFWLSAFPIARSPNSDMIALDLRNNSADPRVTYLCHDCESRTISESFDRFLTDWANIAYAGPEIWILEEFIDAKSQRLNPDPTKADQLRRLLLGKN